MSHSFRIAYFAHSIRSDWNNGNAHFLRGLLRSMTQLGHEVEIYEPEDGWSAVNLRGEAAGEGSLCQFARIYPELRVTSYPPQACADAEFWRGALQDVEVVLLHEWNPPELAQCLLRLRARLGFRLLFHDTHHRACSAAEQIRALSVDAFDGVLAFGDVLRRMYRERFGIRRAWTFHEAADTTVFRPQPKDTKAEDVVWIGNWGEGERSHEICEFLLQPAASLPARSFALYGVRCPEEGLRALRHAGVRYGGYLPNLDAPAVYAAARLTIHIPRRQYATAMEGIPTIRVFEALACGIPLISAPWKDTEHLFTEEDYAVARNGAEMKAAMRALLENPDMAAAQAAHGLETIQARHTCMHRAEQLTFICEELAR